MNLYGSFTESSNETLKLLPDYKDEVSEEFGPGVFYELDYYEMEGDKNDIHS